MEWGEKNKKENGHVRFRILFEQGKGEGKEGESNAVFFPSFVRFSLAFSNKKRHEKVKKK